MLYFTISKDFSFSLINGGLHINPSKYTFDGEPFFLPHHQFRFVKENFGFSLSKFIHYKFQKNRVLGTGTIVAAGAGEKGAPKIEHLTLARQFVDDHITRFPSFEHIQNKKEAHLFLVNFFFW